tara:strand:+ start:3352 stop:4419 length:1068 start_codon:yes stop_codon:yes gene_type:complete
MLKKINSSEFAEEIKIGCNTNFNIPNKIIIKRMNPKRMNPRKTDSLDSIDKKKTYCEHVCEAIPLVFKNFKLKMCDHLLLGGEHIHKVSPGYNSPLKRDYDEEMTSEEKKEIVKATPSFGMFSLFKYHIKRGYLNKELKKTNKIFCSHIFSLIFALPVLIFIGQWLLYIALIINENKKYNGELCSGNGSLENKIMISGISIVYFARSFFIWDNITNSLSLKKMNRVNSITSIIDTFQEFSFSLFVYGANMWVVFVENDIQNMILNSLAMEFLMVLDNEFEELYFQYLPGAADDIYDNIFVSYDVNIELLEKRQKKDKCFNCFSCVLFIPYKLLVISVFLFPAFCFFMIFAGPICK